MVSPVFIGRQDEMSALTAMLSQAAGGVPAGAIAVEILTGALLSVGALVAGYATLIQRQERSAGPVTATPASTFSVSA